jgi:regulator of sigma E protease
MLILTIIIFALILGLLVMVHEFGHFIMAKRAGVEVQEFAFGFKPTIWKKKVKETTYLINAIPLGGYCAMLGEEEHINHPKSFSNASVWNRIKIVTFGVILNFALAWVLMTIWFWVLPNKLPNYIAIVQVEKNSVAEQAGIKANDIILEIDGNKFTSATDVTKYNLEHKSQNVDIKIKRFSKIIDKKVTLSTDEIQPLGIAMADTGGETPKVKWYLAPVESIKEIVAIVWINLQFIWQLISSIFTSVKAPVEEVSGPVGVFTLLYQVVSFGWIYVLRFIALLSVAIGFFNILPFPALDGGRLVFLLLEAVGGKKVVKSEVENYLHWLGFILLLVLMALITYQDIIKWITHR